MLKNIPADFSDFRLMVTEAPAWKMVKGDGDTLKPATDRDGVQQFEVLLFAKRRPQEGGFAGKGEEIKVTLTSDPGNDWDEGTYVQLLEPTVGGWGEPGRGGINFKAKGLIPAS